MGYFKAENAVTLFKYRQIVYNGKYLRAFRPYFPFFYYMKEGTVLFNRVLSAAIVGIDVIPVQVEVDVSDGLPQFTMVGSLTGQVKEAEDRVRTSLRNIGIALPPKKITVNLAPADVLKHGSGFDLPIALGILAGEEKFPTQILGSLMALGELSLDGEINPVSGILPAAMQARKLGIGTMIVPEKNEQEARVVTGIDIIGFRNIRDVLEYLRHGVLPDSRQILEPYADLNQYDVDFSDIRGQENVKRAAVVAAAGFHNLLMIGPPGSGKTMIARRLPTIMPPLTQEESLEISQIYSVAGLLSPEQPFLGTRPFRSPHHTMTAQALAGGGRIPRPGELTLAHRGILFLDEMPEFKRSALEILRQPLEDREIIIARAAGTFRFPAAFLLLAAMNPCPCGHYPDMNRCMCKPGEISAYMHKVSRPLLDRIDLCVECPPVTFEELTEKSEKGRSSESIREDVCRAHVRQKKRFEGSGFRFNSEIAADRLEEFCPMDWDAARMMRRAFEQMQLSARGYHRIIRVARTIADLDGEDIIRVPHVSEAICYRTIDRKYWRV